MDKKQPLRKGKAKVKERKQIWEQTKAKHNGNPNKHSILSPKCVHEVLSMWLSSDWQEHEIELCQYKLPRLLK